MGLSDRARSVFSRALTGAIGLTGAGSLDPTPSVHQAEDSDAANNLAATPRYYGGPGSLTNLVTGLNTTEDSAWWDTWFARRPLSDTQRAILGRDPLVRRILSLPGDDATREGWTVKIQDDAVTVPQATVSEGIKDYEERGGITLASQLRELSMRSRQYGAAFVLLGIDDGRTPDQPVDVDNIRRIWWTATIDRRDWHYGKVVGPRGGTDFQVLSSEEQREFEAGAERFGSVETFRITDINGVLPDGVRYGDGFSPPAEQLLPAANMVVHADRVLYLPYFEALPLLDQMQDALAAYFRGASGISRAIDRASLLVWKIANHIQKSWSENAGIGQRRIREAMRSWGSLGAIVIDKADEDFSIASGGGGQMAGIAQGVNQIMVWISALSGIPVTVLWLVSPGGFGTGESERAQWRDAVRVLQSTGLAPLIRKFARYALAADDGLGLVIRPDRIEVDFADLEPPTEVEKADMLAKMVDLVVKLQATSLYLEPELRRLLPEIELDSAVRAATRVKVDLDRAVGARKMSAEEIQGLVALASAAAIPLTPGGVRALAEGSGTPAALAALLFPDPPLAPLGAPVDPLAPPGETPETADGKGGDPANDAPPPPPEPPSRFIPPDALLPRDIAGELGVPTRTITRMAEKGLITRYIRVGGKAVFSRAEILEAERVMNLTPEEIEAEAKEAAREAAEIEASEGGDAKEND